MKKECVLKELIFLLKAQKNALPLRQQKKKKEGEGESNQTIGKQELK